MTQQDTIAAISTPVGEQAIGIVRMSGQNAIPIIKRIFKEGARREFSQIVSHQVYYGHIIEPDRKEIVDEVLVLVMKAPRSYTREDIVEIHCHGGLGPLRQTLELVLKEGARLAQPGEFTKRAFLNGRIDLAQAESVVELIKAKTAWQTKVALAQLQGGVSQKIKEFRDATLEIMAELEVIINFPDEEDIERVTRQELIFKIDKVKSEMEDLIKSANVGELLRQGVNVAIIGKPNVGKSSLFNALLAQDRAIVTEFPGTTRDTLTESVDIQGLFVTFIDTAGLKEPKDKIEEQALQKSKASLDIAQLLLCVLDGSQPIEPEDEEILNLAKEKKAIIVINKIDLPLRVSLESEVNGIPLVKTAAVRNEGIKELKEEIYSQMIRDKISSDAPIVTSVRHKNILSRAVTYLEKARQGLLNRISPELITIDLKEVLLLLGEIVGQVTSEELLENIFNQFCIGK